VSPRTNVGDDGQLRVMRMPPVIAVEEHRLTLFRVGGQGHYRVVTGSMAR